ncbi:activating signal cointegrator 1 [Chelonus insularis]|uniref:activating signal cointegrator 1 n=1 Tax=Chelonus insularis TaxID=460826 RepID=UPI001589066D|nr:activating signal cointegrator 1 [Chelonus insularis]
MERWINDSLSQLLDFPVPDDLTQYILQIQDERDLDDYLKTLLNFENHKHRNFVTELKRRKASENVLLGYKKVDDNQPIISKQTDKKKNKTSKDKEDHQEASKEKGKKKSKFVNIFSDDGKDKLTIFLKSRMKCDCEAKTHSLINNCLNCGKIVCAQEGSGPCFFCGELVCTPDQQSVLAMNTKQSDNLYNKLMDLKITGDQQIALSQRDKLLEFDRNSTKRTQVIDDECDYYQSSDSMWLSAKERETLKKREEEIWNKKHESRLSKKVTLDFYGRQVIEEPEDFSSYSFDENQEDSSIPYDNDMSLICPTVEFKRPQYIETEKSTMLETQNLLNCSMNNFRVQDKQLLEMSDDGCCLSMHQPYASLLVAGIKKHEGRTWYSAHRGRLWIHAAAKQPSPEEITTIQSFYKNLLGDDIKFPKQYSTGCLLGCVTVTDVIAQDEYRIMYPDGESESPYVFICEDFRELKIKFPMQGKHKIYKLDKAIHKAALKCLR